MIKVSASSSILSNKYRFLKAILTQAQSAGNQGGNTHINKVKPSKQI